MLGMRYIKADPNTYLMQYRHGKLRQAGKGLSFWYFAPVSSLAAIPTASTEVSFAFRELTAASASPWSGSPSITRGRRASIWIDRSQA